METTIQTSADTCPKCNGIGQYNKYGECFSCRGTGKMAFCKDGIITFLGKEYKIGDELPFTNTRSNIKMGKVTGFWDKNSSSFQENHDLKGWMNINDIWYNLIVIETGKKERYCLWRSILKLNK